MGKLVKIKEASDILGVSIRILRGWDAKGIINTVRTPGGTRLFAVEDYLKSQEHAKTEKLMAGPPTAGSGGAPIAELPAKDANDPLAENSTAASGGDLAELDSWKKDVESVFKAVNNKAKNSDTPFPICLEMASRWIGFSRKDHAKTHLVKNYDENTDYISSRRAGKLSDMGMQEENCITKPGPVTESIYLIPECFKALCMTAQTAQGKLVRKFYLDLEKRHSELKARRDTGDLTLAGEVVNQYDKVNGTKTNVLLKTSPIGADGISVNVPKWVPEWRDARNDQKNRGKTLRDVLKELNIPDVNVYACIENMQNQGIYGFSGTTTKWRRDNGIPEGKPLAECMDKTQLDLRRMMSIKLIELYSEVEEPTIAEIKRVAEGVKAKISSMSEYMSCNEYRPQLNEETGEETYIGKRVREIEKAQRRSIKRLQTLERRQALIETADKQLTIGEFFRQHEA